MVRCNMAADDIHLVSLAYNDRPVRQHAGGALLAVKGNNVGKHRSDARHAVTGCRGFYFEIQMN